jgi:hypothetical protein
MTITASRKVFGKDRMGIPAFILNSDSMVVLIGWWLPQQFFRVIYAPGIPPVSNR